MGVEPTQQRMAPPTGFEARPIHQDGFPSVNLGSPGAGGTAAMRWQPAITPAP